MRSSYMKYNSEFFNAKKTEEHARQKKKPNFKIARVLNS